MLGYRRVNQGNDAAVIPGFSRTISRQLSSRLRGSTRLSRQTRLVTVMTHPAIVRAAYLHLYFDLLRELGIPIRSALASSRLPYLIEENPDAYVSLPWALESVARAVRDIAPTELAFLSSRRVALDCFDTSLRASLHDATSGLACIERYFRLIAVEDSSLRTSIEREGDRIRLVKDLQYLNAHPDVCLAEWVNIGATIAVISSFAGPDWSPTEIALVSRQRPPDAAFEQFGATRIRTGQPRSSILVEAEILARPGGEALRHTPNWSEIMGSGDGAAACWTLKTALRAAILPYISEGRHSLSWAAELTGMSPRTLQRRLRVCGTSYSAVVQEARIEYARSLLSDASLSVTNIAMSSGYEHPQHFSRAFRRLTGVAPSAYRRFASQV